MATAGTGSARSPHSRVGLSTREIADALSYSKSTAKKDQHELITRFGLRNRTQAVAFAIRVGML